MDDQSSFDVLSEGGYGNDTSAAPDEQRPPGDTDLADRIKKTIKGDKSYHGKAFKRMARNMRLALKGSVDGWHADNYRANIVGRHIRQKTATLYAKNPKAAARRRPTLDFAVWDENPETLELAVKAVQQATVAVNTPPLLDPGTGQYVTPPFPPGVDEAQALIEDFQQGMQRRQQIARIGKTLEILFEHSLLEQQPLDFKSAMKQVVRRASTTGVGYIKLGFQREYGPSPIVTGQLDDAQARLAHLERLAGETPDETTDAEIAELNHAVEGLMQQPEVVTREGLLIGFPQSTKVVPDRLCQSLQGFVGARHLTIEYLFTKQEVEERFGVKVDSKFTPYTSKGDEDLPSWGNDVVGEYGEHSDSGPAPGRDLVCVWEHYDKPSGLVYYVADGYPDFLQEPGPPDVYLEDFWPLYALTFNAVESEEELFPPSDAELLESMAEEYNRSRQGKREHRKAARPRWGYPRGSLDESDIEALQNCEAFEAIALNKDPSTKLAEILEVIPVPGVDPNLYDVNEIYSDAQLVVGMNSSQYGGTSKATATGDAIAANAVTSSDSASIDDLDACLTWVARKSGQILMREMSEEKVKEIVGPGAVWPQQTLDQIAAELYLDVAAGATGKPNQAVEINNWKQIVPLLLQMPRVSKTWLAKQTILRLDDDADLTEAIAESEVSAVAANALATSSQAQGPSAATAPEAQGPQGAANAETGPGGPGGTDPAFGSNQV